LLSLTATKKVAPFERTCHEKADKQNPGLVLVLKWKWMFWATRSWLIDFFYMLLLQLVLQLIAQAILS
jgi:hypothetical protein